MTELVLPRFYRSWPSPGEWAEKQIDGRAHIIDDMPRIIMSQYDYKTVTDHNSLGTSDGWPEELPGFCMLEFDIALDPVAQRIFAAQALIDPRTVLVAPYRFHDTWITWIGETGYGPSLTGRPTNEHDCHADSFGLGCIYIPRTILNEFLAVMDKFGFNDGTFGQWYRDKYGPVRLTHSVHPQHLHQYV